MAISSTGSTSEKGDGLVRLADKVVCDGDWHEVKLERHSNSAEISVDSKWRTHGAPPSTMMS